MQVLLLGMIHRGCATWVSTMGDTAIIPATESSAKISVVGFMLSLGSANGMPPKLLAADSEATSPNFVFDLQRSEGMA